MKTKSTSLITKNCKWKLNTIFHILDQQNTSAITDVYTARESQFDNIYSKTERKVMLRYPLNLLLRIYFNKISRQAFKPWGAEMFIRAKKSRNPFSNMRLKYNAIIKCNITQPLKIMLKKMMQLYTSLMPRKKTYHNISLSTEQIAK